jgi:hypothetical protein
MPVININFLLKTVKVHVQRPLITIAPGMSGLENPIRNDWLYIGLLGLQSVARRKQVTSAAFIGSSNGIDAIAGSHLFSLNRMYVTDVLAEIMPGIEENVQLASRPTPTTYFIGRDCEPLPTRVDLIYGNLPLIMVDANQLDAERATTTLTDRAAYAPLAQGTNDPLLKWSLLSQLGFLLSAKEKLNPGGSIITLLGGRVPRRTIDECFMRAGLQHKELFHGLKRQSDPEYLREYAEHERAIGEPFVFYNEQLAKTLLAKRGLSYPRVYEKDSDAMIRSQIEPAQINAQQAYDLHRKGKHVAHITYAFEATVR